MAALADQRSNPGLSRQLDTHHNDLDILAVCIAESGCEVMLIAASMPHGALSVGKLLHVVTAKAEGQGQG